jgi:outer membrane immunogenic protein
MRKVLLSLAATASLMLGATGASADGMPGGGGGMKDFACVPVFQGFYVGGQGGYAQYTAHQNDLDGFFRDNSGWTATQNKFTGGVQVGYNFQRSCGTLFGVEADWSWANLDATILDNPNGGGLVIDNLLLYATGGLALASIEFKGTDTFTPFSFSDTRWGWTAGFGTELALSRNLSFKSEIVYMNFDDKNYTVFTNGGGRFAFKIDDSIWVGRVGLNYRF